MRHFFVFLFLFSLTCQAQQAKGSVFLERGKKMRKLSEEEFVSIRSVKPRNGPYTEAMLQFEYNLFMRQDTLFVRPLQSYTCTYANGKAKQELTRLYEDTTVIHLALSTADIDEIYIENDAVGTPCGIVAAAGLGSALIVAPLVSLGSPFKKERFFKVAGFSLGAFAAAVTINLTLGHKTYHFQKKNKSRNWKIRVAGSS